MKSPSTSKKIRFEAESTPFVERTVNLTMDMNLTDGAKSTFVDPTVNLTTDMDLTEAGENTRFFSPRQMSTPIMRSFSVDNIYSKLNFLTSYLFKITLKFKKNNFVFFIETTVDRRVNTLQTPLNPDQAQPIAVSVRRSSSVYSLRSAPKQTKRFGFE